ncbi:Uncharacterised protein [Mycobacteroides abscessus subsp. abscessus]|nr:Uncharacterised protein [Mycobacteroides abscessus subsp. abscessus]SIH59458.1 Uncharacterised protein [Mycobacteroides abscessus subsp. abscessus]SII91110.1 Uncharacterised protein [Mycobacteroides abscessus subsp. abscessus]SIJ45857.1 Uncharacterised protein [Mycobacteroides abscessus subsp. abscessus]SIK06648.1 Uncharacterised protein [Mycobacteroides abscessus subsp. abscessus]
MTTLANPRLPTRVDFAAKMKPHELDGFDVAIHESGHAVRGLLLGGEVHTAGIYGGPVTGFHGRTRFREAFTREHVSPVAHAGPHSHASWVHGSRRPTIAQVDAVLAAGGCHDMAQIERAHAMSGGLLAVDKPGEDHLLNRTWPGVMMLAAELYRRGELDHDAVLSALGLNRESAVMKFADLRSGGTFRLNQAHTRF